MDNYMEVEETLVQVKVIRSKGQVSLIQWNDEGRIRRMLVPRMEVVEDETKRTYIPDKALAMGIPYGANWEARLKESYIITGEKIAEQLEAVGIWTKEDYDQNPSIVHQAVLGAARQVLSELHAVAHSIPKQED